MLKWILPILTLIFCGSLSQAADDKPESDAAEIGLELNLDQTLLITLENSVALSIQKLDPLIAQKNESIARARFDPTLSAGANIDADEVTTTSDAFRSATDGSFDLGLSKEFATGTTVQIGVDLKRDETTSTSLDDMRYSDSLAPELRITQSLLRGRGLGVNLANVRRAEINTAISQQQLRRYIETLIFNTTTAYWNLFLEREKLIVYQESYDLALEHENEVEVFIRNGKLPEIERSTVKAEVSSRRERLIQARGAIEKARLALIATTNLYSISEKGWDESIIPTEDPHIRYEDPGEITSYVDVALLKRPEVLETELRLRRERVDLVATENGLLPKLDFFISMGRTEYANAFHASNRTENNNQSISSGLSYSIELGRRAEKARYEQGVLGEKRAELALKNLKDSINREVRQAYVDCTTDLETIDAVSVTMDLRRQSLNTQTIKFELGEATNTEIANAQRDLLQSQINHTEAVVNYVKSRLRLHYLDGSLIERSGVNIP